MNLKLKNGIAIILLIFCYSTSALAQQFDNYFTDNTLRLDYDFSGDKQTQTISLNELCETKGWAGRRHHLSELPLRGNGQVVMKDVKTGTIIYETSFSSLFQEYLSTKEAENLSKSFENTFLVPFPKQEAEIEVKLLNNKDEILTDFKHIVNPSDILIHKKGYTHVTPHEYLLKSGSPEDCIDIAILGEGYTSSEMDSLKKDAETAVQALFEHEPFKKYQNRFNIVLVNSVSEDSGVSTPRLNDWRNTVFGSNFDSFYSDRYLTTNQIRKIHDELAGVPYEHIIILANTTVYGGGGIYNAFTLTAAHHANFKPVVVHEFGHSFGGLADEYFYENDALNATYDLKTEPWEQNITTLTDFSSKWKDMLEKGTPIPTPPNENKYKIGVFEGAGYSAKGIYKGCEDCRMRTNTAKAFCPVCQRALERIIRFYTDKN